MNGRVIDIKEDLGSLCYEADGIRAIVWAADQLLLERNDLRISVLQEQSRVSRLLDAALQRLEKLCDDLGAIEAEIPIETIVNGNLLRRAKAICEASPSRTST